MSILVLLPISSSLSTAFVSGQIYQTVVNVHHEITCPHSITNKTMSGWFVYFGCFEFFTNNKKLRMSHQRLSKVKAKNIHPIGLDLFISVCQSNTLHSRPPAIQTLLKSETINCFLPNEFNCSGMKIWELKWACMIPKGWEHAFSLWVASYGLRDALDICV